TVMSAAVADFTPKDVAFQKIKKENNSLDIIKLVETTDILATLGQRKKDSQILIGFALETDDGRASAEGKLQRKNLDFIVLNSTSDEGAGFAGDSNKITIIHRNLTTEEFELKPKTEVAADICTRIVKLANS